MNSGALLGSHFLLPLCCADSTTRTSCADPETTIVHKLLPRSDTVSTRCQRQRSTTRTTAIRAKAIKQLVLVVLSSSGQKVLTVAPCQSMQVFCRRFFINIQRLSSFAPPGASRLCTTSLSVHARSQSIIEHLRLANSPTSKTQ